YMILGLGDVYLSAPCAVPLDPRHRLLSSKYNPARSFTAEGTVGIGGMYMCIYGMDSPGGYQLVGRTVPIWNKYQQNPQVKGQPWFLRYFDQIQYFAVTEAALDQWREDFRYGRAEIEIIETEFDFAQYQQFLQDNADSIVAFNQQQQQAFVAETARWQADDVAGDVTAPAPTLPSERVEGRVVNAEMSGNLWKIMVSEGQIVQAGEPLLVVEAMKMELAIHAPTAGVVAQLLCQMGQTVTAGDMLLVLQELPVDDT
ncbi:MAG: biotin/lipoyl-containing protein, partial [Pseudomonadota bacterium]|nr:biotin/lipoyl-containing protein [Pseudomonadota bacterium]